MNKIKFYDYLLFILKPLIVILGHIGLPKRKFTGTNYYKLISLLEIGDTLLTKTDYEFSNLINPTKIKHGALYVGNVYDDGIPYVFESIGDGVTLTDLYTFCKNKDLIVSVRCKKSTKLSFSPLSKIVLRYKGIKYDYLFNGDGKAFYCFELCGVVLREIFPTLKLKLHEVVKGKEIFDHNTFLDSENFTIIYDSRLEGA